MERLRFVCLVVAAGAVCLLPARAAGQQEFADSVDAAIEKGVGFLLARQQANGSWVEYEGHEDKLGMTPLVCYALMESGVSPQSESMLKALTYLDEQGPIGMVYGAGLRAVALQVANEQTNDKYFRTLRVDVGYLAQSQTGRYHYQEMDGTSWDNSNGQYAALGVWAGEENGRLDVPDRYWKAVQRQWYSQQNPDGGWGYYDGSPYTQAPDGRYYYGNATQATMTVGGIATLYICEDNLPPSQAVISCDNVTMDPHIARGLQWMNGNFRWTLDQPHIMLNDWYYYYLYGVERAALASGQKYFGGLDWYKAGADRLLSRQASDGSWIGTEEGVSNVGKPGRVQAHTAFALLFLIRGRQPLIFNKLQFTGDWNNRSRDLAVASRWLSKTYEHSVNWQIVKLGMPLDEWRDAPILYISAKGPASFTPIEVAKLREYVNQGGTIVSVAEAGGAGFNPSIRALYQQAFPRYSLEACGEGHRLYNYPNDIDPAKVKIFELSNGVRPLAIHVESDLSLAWEKRDFVRDRWAFEALANITLYSVENLIDLPRRRVNLWPGGQSSAFASGGGGGAICDVIYLEIGGSISPVDASAAGQQVQAPDGSVVTIPQPDASGRTIVYCEPTDQYISVENHRLGQTLPAPNGQQFLAKASEAAAPAAPATVQPSPSGRADLTVIRLKNDGDTANCNPEPLAWQRFAVLLNDRTGTGVAVVGPVDITDLNNQAGTHSAKLAVMTGTEAFTLSDAEQQAIKTFIEGGGTLFVDASGGPKATTGFGSAEGFADSVEKAIESMYGRRTRLTDIPRSAPLFQLTGHEIKSVSYRVRTAERLGTNEPKLKAMHLPDRDSAIIFSEWDVTTGLVGFNSGALEGYTPESAYAIMRNIVLSMGK